MADLISETREETLLAGMSDPDIPLPDPPYTRKEQLLVNAIIAIRSGGDGGGGGGVTSYTYLSDKPKIAGKTLVGDQTPAELGLAAADAIPTMTSDLTDDVGYAKSADVTTALASKADAAEMTTALSDKVDKVDGMGLSANSYTTNEKAKLAGIEAGAQVNPDVASAEADGLMSADDKSRFDAVMDLLRGATLHRIVSGDPAVARYAVTAPVTELTVQIRAVQSGDGDPSPDNIRPISGWDTATVTQDGKNLWGNGDITITGWTAVDGRAGYETLTRPLPAGTYTFSADITVDDSEQVPRFELFSGISPAVSQGVIRLAQSDTERRQGTITISETAAYYRFFADRSNALADGKTASFARIQIERGGEATAYAPYAGDHYSVAIPLGEPVYGGSLDVLSGTLTVTHEYIESYDGEELPGAWISDRDVYEEGTVPTTGAQVVYELTELRTVQLAAHSLTIFTAGNWVGADTGLVTIEYKATLPDAR